MEGVEEEAVEGMGTGAGREVGLAEASLMDLALALDSERAAASWASFSLDLRIRRRVLMIEEEEQATGVSEGGELKTKGFGDSLHNVVDSMQEDGISNLLPLSETESRKVKILVLSNDGKDRILQRIDSAGRGSVGREGGELLHEGIDDL